MPPLRRPSLRPLSICLAPLARSLTTPPPPRAAPPTRAPPPSRRDTQTLLLPDGRTLAWAEYGDARGHPTLFLHGFPGSRLEPAGLDSAARQHGVRLLTPDRPGFGRSTFHEYSIASWPADASALLHHLGIGRASVLGGSGGGPFALACALPSRLGGLASSQLRLDAVGVLAGAPPWHPQAGPMPTSSRVARLVTVNTPLLAEIVLSATLAAARWGLSTPPARRRLDQWTGSREATQVFLRTALEGFAQGSGAAVYEANLLSSDGGVPFDKIQKEVIIWHGTKDARAPINAIRWKADQIPRAELIEFDTGHFDIHVHIEEVFRAMLPK